MKKTITTIAAALVTALSTSANPIVVTPQMRQEIAGAAPAAAPAKPEKPRKILILDKAESYQHDCIPVANAAFEILGEKTGAYTVVITHDKTMLNPAKLAEFDAILFNNTTQLTFTPGEQKALLDFVKSGKGFIGIHAASDNFPGWQEAQDMIGGCFDGHPWTADGTWAVKNDDPTHPLNKSFDGKGFKIRDEIYQIKGAYSRKTLRVLLSLDMSDPATAGAHAAPQKRADKDYGISWIRPYGKGRVFYCSLGHNPEVYWNPVVLAHYLSGIQYALGNFKVDDSPSTK
jgi:uncharacterized protein